jgi:glycosyltransferase involved in cell wall biosynthesis
MWCPPGSPELIREKILSASEDREKLREMGRRGRRAAVEWYSTETAVQAYEKVFSED